jgi:hypothetical protein
MSQKYTKTSKVSSIPRAITADTHLAAYLLSVGCHLDKVMRNDRHRVSFVFEGERVRELKQAYKAGPVYVDIRSFRGNLTTIKDLVGITLKERSRTWLNPLQQPLPVHGEENASATQQAARKITA